MHKFAVFTVLSVSLLAAEASWYWPFGSDEKEEPRLSELMEPASLLIDEASDLASEGKVSDAVEKYRAALVELDKVEAENPERVEKPEFATVKTKRAYVSAAIDSLLLNQARDNARAVAVSDTRELEQRLADERAGRRPAEKPKAEKPADEEKTEESDEKDQESAQEKEEPSSKLPAVKSVETLPEVKGAVAEAERKAARRKAEPKTGAQAKSKNPSRPLTKREQVIRAIAAEDYATADRLIGELLAQTPNNAVALNLKAVREAAEGRYAEAENTLDQAIASNPRDYHAYYNMAQLFLQTRPGDTAGARRYYETGRTYGGPVDKDLEAEFK